MHHTLDPSITVQPLHNLTYHLLFIKCAQFISNPTDEHWQAAKWILWYLIYTRNFGIIYKSEKTGITGYAHHLARFTDADFAGDINDRKLTSGWRYSYNGSLISWSSNKQNIITQCMMEAELVAGSFASVDGIWLLKLGKDFNLVFKLIPLFADNKSYYYILIIILKIR